MSESAETCNDGTNVSDGRFIENREDFYSKRILVMMPTLSQFDVTFLPAMSVLRL
jgi:hypothetical protein